MAVTPYQERVYTLLSQIPSGKVSSYAALAKALDSSPRAVGGALRRNPFAPEVPCHRCIASTGFIGGFQGDWQDAPSGQNQNKKLNLLQSEGVQFDKDGMLLDQTCWWDSFKV
ncbi:DNA binding methylated-DNA--cysteine S-methyltransferase [Xylona heveae TC161]|uniref:Methylated-DNA--protein-cysteine methyltransferase n=1 Tax=Xylona heveae (strain CBS 132557 / TC161) TaxID=1328760 RepID=A0A165HJ45_XYLHT|nr:DNA binding methylated-DNA--cysteine S-methyltransferase [Xylona heveae TC161]KZF23595.1 DNA binding methylated-DNA--cysteine S-methyltransferase [Xylona heveae TC161]